MMRSFSHSFGIVLAAAAFIGPARGLLAASAEEAPVRKPGAAGGWPELSEPAALERSQGVKEKLMLVSWGDLIFFYGPETDAGLYCREQIERMMSYWRRNGFTQVYWRAENLPIPDWKWNETTIYADASFIKAEADRIHAREDTTRSARQAAREKGLQFWFWHSIYDEGTPPDKKHRLWGDFPWRHTFFDDNPGLETTDRQGGVQWGVPEMAYQVVRKRKIEQYLEFVRRYRPDGVLVYLHSHSAPGVHGDQYGFNQIIVDEYKRRYGVDIRTDPRFDCAKAAFDQKDPMVEKWRELRGEHLTQFLRELRAELRRIAPEVKMAVNTQGGDYFGPPFGNMKIAWRTWIREGLIDVLLVRTWMAGGCGAYDFRNEHYLTWGDGNIGVAPYDEIRRGIDNSRRKILLISRSRTYIPGADGYYDATNRDVGFVKNQRAEQLSANLKRYGAVGWIEQDFDGLDPLEQKGYLDFRSGSKRYFVGDPRYYASANRSPGMAGPLTSDPARSPALVPAGPGGKGAAPCLREQGLPLVIFRRTGPDWPDEPISKGKAAVCFDLLRKPGSALAMTTSHGVRGGRDLPAAGEQNVQLQVDGEGAVSAWNGAQWRPARAPHAADRWTTIRLELDYAAATIAVEVGGRTRATLPFDPSNLVFDGLAFACSKGEVLLDNVQVRWSW